MSSVVSRNRFSAYAWFVVAFNVLVIAWGAIVRATGSGGGCGSHWPQCNGEIIPTLTKAATAIEFGHRLTSGLAGLFVLVLVIWSFRKPASRSTRLWSCLGFVFILLEGFIGAVLVRLELVADNTSTLRAVVIALHLVNTLFLLASLALTAWSSQHSSPLSSTPKRLVALQLGVGLIGTIVVSAAGAVTALGDTLFPSQTLAAGLNADFDPTTAFLLRLRVIHPVVAILTVVFLLVLSRSLSNSNRAPATVRSVNRLYLLIVLQIAAGVLNVVLLAPLWMQIIHLVLADGFWLNLVVLTAEILVQTSAVMIGPQKVAELL